MAGGMKNWRFWPISRFSPKMVKDTAIVTVEDEQGLVTRMLSIEWCHFE